jgi:prolipoprotein diacylglyceryltransferase
MRWAISWASLWAGNCTKAPILELRSGQVPVKMGGLLTYIVVGVIAGGRLGYVLFL